MYNKLLVFQQEGIKNCQVKKSKSLLKSSGKKKKKISHELYMVETNKRRILIDRFEGTL